MSKYILASSFVIAVILEERLHQGASEFLIGSTISAVYHAEIWTKLNQIELLGSNRVDQVFALLQRVAPFDVEHARRAALFHAETRHAGLSLGDRVCLALALAINAEAITTDRAWASVDVGCRVRIVR